MNEGGPALVLNAGSTGLKASLHGADGSRLWRGQLVWEDLDPAGALRSASVAPGPGEDRQHDPAGAAVAAAGAAASAEASVALTEPAAAALSRWLTAALKARGGAEPALVGHRVVHGGGRFTEPTRLEPAVLAGLQAITPLAPLHNPPALALIRWALQQWSTAPQWACFDTAFHASLPPEAYTYAIPASWRRQGLRRYGFHGLNHQHVAEVVAARFGSREGGGSREALPAGEAVSAGAVSAGGGAGGAAGAGGESGRPLRLISCHLGGGCSLCAIEAGRSIATTMGFTPLEGLVMASRSGSLDPGLLLHQLRGGLDRDALERGLQREGGLLGLSELSASMEELRAAAAPPPAGAGHAGAQLAIAVFRRRLLEGIGAMAACLGGVDVIALSGGIGEHDVALRQELENALAWLGPVALLVIPADEEGVIVRSCLRAGSGQAAAIPGG